MWLIRLTPRLSRRRAAELDALVHCANDILLAQELVRDELPRPDSNFECDATSGNHGDFGQGPNVVYFLLRRCYVQVVHVVNDFRFQWVPALLRLWRWRRRGPAEKVAPGMGDTPNHRRPRAAGPPRLRSSTTRAAGHEHRLTACSCCSSAESFTPIQGRVPAACRAAVLPRASAAIMPRAKLHSSGPSTSPCSAPRSLGIGGSPSCSTKDKFRCFHAVAAVRLGRDRDAALQFSHPKGVFLVDFDFGQRPPE